MCDFCKISPRCFSERHAFARQISNYYSKSHFAESRLFRRTFHDYLINPNKQKTQNETKNIIIGKSSKLCFASENVVRNSEYKTNNKATDRHDKHVYDKSGKSFPKASITKSCIFLFHRIKNFSSPKIKIWFEPMFFSGFFCGFERCGSAAFPNFRGGISSPPQAAKCV